MQYKKGDEVVLNCTEEEFCLGNTHGLEIYNNCFHDGVAIVDLACGCALLRKLAGGNELRFDCNGDKYIKLKEQSTMQENLTEHEKHMTDILVRKIRGLAVEVQYQDKSWHDARGLTAVIANTYRVPPRKIIIPWDLIDDKWVAWAMDKNKKLYLYSNIPSVGEKSWSGAYLHFPLKIDTTGIDWKDSLTLREDK